jgi:hypothetical protein
MRHTALFAVIIACSCGGKAATHEPGAAGMSGGSSPGSAGESSTPASDGLPPTMCHDDMGCSGLPCIEIYPGHNSCIFQRSEAVECRSELDECCSSSDCAKGKCHDMPFPRSTRCNDTASHNVCASDQCTPGSCGPEGACLPAGTLGPVAMCIKAGCQTDADCDAEPGGSCLLVQDPCCNGAYLGLLCSYPGRGCWFDGNCDLGFCGMAANGKDSACRGSLVCPE